MLYGFLIFENWKIMMISDDNNSDNNNDNNNDVNHNHYNDNKKNSIETSATYSLLGTARVIMRYLS